MFKKNKLLTIIILILFISSILFITYNEIYPLEGEVGSFTPQINQGFVGEFLTNDGLKNMNELATPNCKRPETIIVHDGWVYGSFHGKIARMREDGSDFKLIADTNGETLGFDFDSDGNLIFTDVKYNGKEAGVYKLNPNEKNPKITPVCREIGGVSLKCPDALTISKNGIIYITDACQFRPLDYENADLASTTEFWYHTKSGKILAYDPITKKGWKVASGFSFANGISLSEDEKYLYLSETMGYSIWKIKTDAVNAVKYDNFNGSLDDSIELLIDNLPGYPDNLMKGEDGRYWVGLVNIRSNDSDSIFNYGSSLRADYLRHYKITVDVNDVKPGFAGVFAFDENGTISEFLMYPNTEYTKTTGAFETKNRLYIHSNSVTGTINYIDLN